MPITWNDFDKIWAVSSPLTPYTFSDLNYAAGWDFIGSTPPARQMWDSLQKANDEKFKFLRDNFGTPNMVTTAAQMTDTDKIYVYVGSEAGWNNGHWYYYDAGTSAWVDGGVYNSTAFVTDTTLTEAGKAADAKAVGDALALKADLAGATFTGNVAVNADFSTTGDATVASDLTVSGATNLTGNVTTSGNVSVVGDIDADNITLTGDISATDVTASGDVTAGALSVSGATTLTGNVTAGADITASGDVTANDASFVNATLSGTLSVTGATTLDGVTAGGVSAQSLNTTGNASVGGTLTVSGATTLADITAGDINADDITATGDISADDITANTLTVSGASTLTGNITAGADITVTGDLSVNDITASGDITADDVTANGNLSVVGNATLSGTSTAVTPAEDDNSTKIATTAYVQTEIKPIETDVTINDKRISNIEKLLQGNLYDYQTDSTSAYTKTVLAGAMPYASLDSIGGKTLVWNQLNRNNRTSTTTHDLTFTNNGDGSWTINGTASANSDKPLGDIPITAGHTYLLKGCPAGGGSSTYRLTISGSFGNDVGSGSIFTPSTSATLNVRMDFKSGVSFSTVTIYPQLFDLTLMYGSGNEPTTVAEFTEQFPAQYYAFNEGTLLSAGVTSVLSNINLVNNTTLEQGTLVSSTGEEVAATNRVRTDFMPANPSTSYHFTVENVSILGIYQYKNDKTFVRVNSYSNVYQHDAQITMESTTGYLRVVYRFSDNSTIVPSDVKNPIVEYTTPPHIYPIPAEIQALEGYGWSAGSVYNYIDYERKVFVKRVASVDLGTLSWIYLGDAGHERFSANVADAKPTTGNDVVGNVVCAKYITTSFNDVYSHTSPLEISVTNTSKFGIYDSNYTDASTFTTAMSGVYAYYELATPVEVDISAYLTDDNLISVESGGTLTFPNSNGDDYRIDVPSSETYMVDLQASL